MVVSAIPSQYHKGGGVANAIMVESLTCVTMVLLTLLWWGCCCCCGGGGGGGGGISGTMVAASLCQ